MSCIHSNSLKNDLTMEANTINSDQNAPKGSSLIWVHIVCSIGYQSTQTDERADNIGREWWERG